MGATSRRNVTFGGSSAAESEQVKTNTGNNPATLLRRNSIGTSSDFERNRPGNNRLFAAIVHLQTPADVQIVPRRVGSLGGGHGEGAGLHILPLFHVDHANILGAD